MSHFQAKTHPSMHILMTVFLTMPLAMASPLDPEAVFLAKTNLTYKETMLLGTASQNLDGSIQYQLVSGPCRLNGAQLTADAGEGTCQIRITQAGNQYYQAVDMIVPISLSKENVDAVFGNPGTVPLDQSIDLKQMLQSQGHFSKSAINAPVTWTLDGTQSSANCSIDGHQVLTSTSPGSCALKVTQAGTNTSNPLQTNTTFNFGKGNPHLQITNATEVVYGASLPLTTSSLSAGNITWSLDSGPCQISANTLTPNQGSGSCTIRATQAATNAYNPDNVTALIQLKPAAATLTFTTPQSNPASLNYNDRIVLKTESDNSNPVSFAVTSGSDQCSLSQNILSANGSGSCTVTATQNVSKNHQATSKTQDFNLNKIAPSITVSSPATLEYQKTLDVSSLVQSPSIGSKTYALNTQSQGCTLDGSTITATSGSGNCVVDVAQSANGHYLQGQTSITVGLTAKPSTLAFTNPNTLAYGQSLTLNAQSQNPNTVTYTNNTPTSCTLNQDGTLTAIASSGTCRMTASQNASENYQATSQSQVITLEAAPSGLQAVSNITPLVFGTSVDPKTFLANIPENASLSFAPSSSNCTYSSANNRLTANAGSGVCVLTVTQNASTNAQSKTLTLNIPLAPANAGLDLSQTKNVLGYNNSIPLIATSSNPNPVQISIDSSTNSNCQINDHAIFALTGTGNCIINATQKASGDYASASASKTIVLQQQIPSLTITSQGPATYGTGFTLTASTKNTDIPVVWKSLSPSVCSVSNSTMTPITAGSCQIEASQADNPNYDAQTITASITINAASPNISVPSSTNLEYLGTLDVSTLVTTLSTGSKSYALDPTSSGCTLAGSTITATSGSGSCIVNMTQNADQQYAAGNASIRVNLTPVLPSIVFTSPNTLAYGQSLTPQASSSNPNPITYTTSGSSCDLFNGKVRALGVGSNCTLTATQQASDKYAAGSALQAITITAIDPNLQLKSLPTTLEYQKPSSALSASNITTLSSAPVTITVTGECSIDADKKITANAATGNCTVTASQAAFGNYTQGLFEINIPMGPASVTLTPTHGKTAIYNTALTLGAQNNLNDSAITYTLKSGNCSLNGNQLTANTGNGTCVIQIDQAASSDGKYQAASLTDSIQLAPKASTLTITPPNPLAYHASWPMTAESPNPNPITFILKSGNCSINNGILTSNAGSGSCSVNASQKASTNYQAISQDFTVNLGLATPVLTLTANKSALSFPSGTAQVTATSSSPSSINLSSNAACSLAAVASNVWVITATDQASSFGDCVISATQLADTQYTSQTASLTLTMSAVTPTLTLTGPSSLVYQGSLTPQATSNPPSNGDISYALDSSGNCSMVSGQVIANQGTGSCLLTATQSASDPYPEITASQIITLTPKTATLAISGPSTLPFNESATFSVTSSNSNPITYSTVGSCSANGNVITANSVGSCTLTASQKASSTHSATSQSFSISTVKANRNMKFTNPDYIVSTEDLTLTIDRLGEGEVSFSTSSQDCSLNDNVLSIVNTENAVPENCLVTASILGDDYYNQQSISQTISVIDAAAGPTLVSPSPNATLNYGKSYPLVIKNSQTYSIQSSGNCSQNSGSLEIGSSQNGNSCTLTITPLSGESITHTWTLTQGAPNLAVTNRNVPRSGLDLNTVITSNNTSDPIILVANSPCSISADRVLTFSTDSRPGSTCKVSIQQIGSVQSGFAEGLLTDQVFTLETPSSVSTTISNWSLPSTAAYKDRISLTATSNNPNPMIYTVSDETKCSIENNVLTILASNGACTVSLAQEASEGFGAVLSSKSISSLTKATPRILDFNPPTTIPYNQSIWLSANSSNSDGDAQAVAFSVSSHCSIAEDGHTLTFNSDQNAGSTCTIMASSPASTNFDLATETATVTLAQTNPVITFTAPTNSTLTYNTSTPVTVSSNNSQNTPNIVVDSGPCTLDAQKNVKFNNTAKVADACVIKAEQNASSNFYAGSATKTLYMTQSGANQLTWNAATSLAYQQSLTIAASSNNPNPIRYSLVEGSCTLSGNLLTASDASGSCKVRAEQDASSAYLASTLDQVIELTKAPAVITVSVDASNSNPSFTETVTLDINSNHTESSVTLSASPSNSCLIQTANNATTLTSSQAQTCTITASQSASDHFSAASNATLDITFGTALPTLTVNASTVQFNPSTATSITLANSISSPSSGSYSFALQSGSPAYCSLSNGTLSFNANTPVGSSCTVQISQAANGNYSALSNQAITYTVVASAPTASFTSPSPGSKLAYNSVTALAIQSNNPNPPQYSVVSGNCTVANNAVTMKASTGSCTIRATQNASQNYEAISIEQTYDAEKAIPNLRLDNPPSTVTYSNNSSVTLQAISDSLGSISLSNITGNCSANGMTLSFTAAATSGDTCSFQLSQAAAGDYQALINPVYTLTLKKAVPSLSFTGSDDVTYGGSVNLTSSVQSSNTDSNAVVNFAVIDGKCSINNNILSFNSDAAPGNVCQVHIWQNASSNFEPAAPIIQNFTLIPANQSSSLVINAPSSLTYGQSQVLTASSDNPNPVKFTVASGRCTISGDVLSTAVNAEAGDACLIKAEQEASAQYAAPSVAEKQINIIKATPVLHFNNANILPYQGRLNLSVSHNNTDSPQPVLSLTVNNSDNCTLENAVLTSKTGTGTCTVIATLASSQNFEQATSEQIITLQNITSLPVFSNPSSLKYGQSMKLSLVSPNPNPVSYSASGNCTLNNDQITANAADGICSITATQTASSNYQETSTPLSIGMTRDDPIIIYTSADTLAYNQTLNLSASSNGDGVLSFAVDPSTSGACSISNSHQLLAKTGNDRCLVNITSPQTTKYNAASITVPILLSAANTASLAFPESPINLVYGKSLTLAANSTNNPNPISYQIQTTSGENPGCTLNGNILTAIQGSGSCSVIATQQESTNYASTSATLIVHLQPDHTQASFKTGAELEYTQSLDLNTLVTQRSSSMPISYQLTNNSDPCLLSGSTLTANSGTGSCTIQATQSASPNGHYAQTQQYIVVTLKKKVSNDPILVSVGQVDRSSWMSYYNTPIRLFAKGGESTGAYSYAIVEGGAYCTLSGNLLLPIDGGGTCTVVATKASDSNYEAQTSYPITLLVAPIGQTATLTLRQDGRSLVMGNHMNLDFVGGNGKGALAVSTNAEHCVFDAGTSVLTGISPGVCTINFLKEGDEDYLRQERTATISILPILTAEEQIHHPNVLQIQNIQVN